MECRTSARLASIRERRKHACSDEVLASRSDAVPATVRAAVLARAARLSPLARSTLDLVAVIPDRADLALVATSTGGDTAGVDDPSSVEPSTETGLPNGV